MRQAPKMFDIVLKQDYFMIVLLFISLTRMKKK